MQAPAETDLHGPVLAWLRGAGVGEPFAEVPTHGRSRADVVGIRSADGMLVTVEIKVRDWRRAVHQALLNKYVANESYVAMWWSSISRGCEAECAEAGIGLLSVEPEGCSVVVRAAQGDPSPRLMSLVRDRLVKRESDAGA
jgi:hypothetical protein